jgi:acetyl esterase
MKATVSALLLLGMLALLNPGVAYTQTASYAVTMDKAINGGIRLDPSLPADGKYPAGTVVTVTAASNAGYAWIRSIMRRKADGASCITNR